MSVEKEISTLDTTCIARTLSRNGPFVTSCFARGTGSGVDQRICSLHVHEACPPPSILSYIYDGRLAAIVFEWRLW